jgi:DNA invertase Pin-like site-specific DNA recombinase
MSNFVTGRHDNGCRIVKLGALIARRASRRVFQALTMPDRRQQTLVPLKQVTPAMRAVAYVRMSTEHQRYSVFNQLTVIKQYAAERQLSLVRVYSDEGISGLKIENRHGLQSLIKAVAAGKPDFRKVLVYDVSRWGRFQDTDQGAFYEYLCRMNGVDIIYCAENFQNDHSPISAIIKTIRRAEAADFSRDLSNKVFNGQCNLARRGYVQGGTPRYGLRHILVRDDGRPAKRLLRRTKKLDGYHVELAPGPKGEVSVVREVFRRYVSLGETITQIADYLNIKGLRTRKDHRWNASKVGLILAEEQYIGTLIYNRNSEKLQGRYKVNDQSEWIGKPNAFPAIVDPAVFQKAQQKRRKESERLSDEELLTALRRFLSKHRYITQQATRRFGDVPPYSAYLRRFGSIVNAYRLMGYAWTSKSAN